jgi:UDP-glucuronate 4-epimerase
MNKILVTGCAGFIGSHTTEALLERGHQVVGIDNFDPFYSREIKEKNLSGFIDHPGFTFSETDITQPHALDLLPADIDRVIHLAAKAGVRPSIEDPQGYIKTNISGTQNILDWMVKRNIKKMVFASSSSVYGNNRKLPFSESDNVDFPISPYAFTKKACELMNFTWHNLYQLDIINLRFFTVFGPRQRPDLAIRKFADLIQHNEPINLYGDGTTGRDYTFIDDIVKGVVASLDYINNHEKVYEIINLGNSTPLLLNELADTLFTLMKKEKNIVYLPMQPGDVQYTYADISKARELLGYQPDTPVREGLRKFLESRK